jgi:hypothetical protein
MNTTTKVSQGLTKRPTTAIVKLAAKDRAALVAAHRELEAVDQRLAGLSRLKDLRHQLDEIPALFARGEMSVGDAVRSAPAGLDAASLHSIRSVLSAACKARIKTLLAGVAEIVIGIERQSLELLEAKAATITEAEEATARELDTEFLPSAALSALQETIRRERHQLEFFAAAGITRQALARAMQSAAVEPQPAALADDGETDHAEMLADLK